MEIEQIYKGIDEIILKHIMLNDKAMQLVQSWGYNGFKRFHRINSKKLFCEHQKIENAMFDKYRKVLEIDVDFIKYSPMDLRTHLEKWKNVLFDDIERLGRLNYKHIEAVGISNNVLECVLNIFLHDYEKVCRYIERFNESNWNSIDCHNVDDYIHKKYKEVEEN